MNRAEDGHPTGGCGECPTVSGLGSCQGLNCCSPGATLCSPQEAWNHVQPRSRVCVATAGHPWARQAQVCWPHSTAVRAPAVHNRYLRPLTTSPHAANRDAQAPGPCVLVLSCAARDAPKRKQASSPFKLAHNLSFWGVKQLNVGAEVLCQLGAQQSHGVDPLCP